MSTETKALSQIEKLRLRKQKLEAQLQKAESRHKNIERRQDTRRKILLGAYYLDKIKNEGTLETIKHELNDFLKRDSDRALFELPLLNNEAT